MPVDRTSHLIADLPDGNRPRRSFCRSFLQFLFSNLGLVLLVVGYSTGGAFLFQLLEQYIELQNCQQGSLNESISITNISEQMFFIVHNPEKDNITVQYEKIADQLDSFTLDVYTRRNAFRYSGQDCSTTSGWDFPSALLFTITVITTIGYGHITPTSWEGQITCICYALIGIPLFLLCISNISSVLGDIFRFMYSGLLHCCCCACRIYTRNRRRRMRLIRAGKRKNPQQIDCVGSETLDPSWPEAHQQQSGLGQANDNDDGYGQYIDGDEDDDEDKTDIWDEMESRVPFGAVILIFLGYIGLGGFMFSRFEDWTLVQSIYFCYITLSTIGFGDYVPGITSSSTSGLRFLLASLYILFGLSILAMCFDLIKEGIVDKFRWFAHKIGIIADDEDQIDEDRTRYANFEYDTSASLSQRRETSGKRLIGPMKSVDSFGEPPAYDSGVADGKWSNSIRDKGDPTNQARWKKGLAMKDDKH